MTISEFLQELGKKSAKLLDIILKILLMLTISSVIISLFTSDYPEKIHHLLSNIPIFKINLSLTISDWTFVVQWGSITYLVATIYYLFDHWLIPSGSHVQSIWERFSELLLCIIFVEIIVRSPNFFNLLIDNIIWTVFPILIVLTYGISNFSIIYIWRLKDRKTRK